MTTTEAPAPAVPVSRLRHLVTAGWGALTGITPHVLHHVGPLAGAAVLAGTGGRLLFFAIGLIAAIPMLIRLYRRFRTWAAPAIAIAVFGVTYTLSSVFIGPLISGDGDAVTAGEDNVTTTTHDHNH